MKRKIYVFAVLLNIAIAGNCQFIPVPLNFPDTNYIHYPFWMSVVDGSTNWLMTQRFNTSGVQIPYSFAIHTNDGGDHWQFDSIPVSGTPLIMSLCAVDANTCFYDFANTDWTNSSIWKTTDGGATWAKKTTTQFTGSGSFCDFYHAFDANEGVAVGDPTNGYFEIQRTTDGGDSWIRVESALIPPPLAGEWGFNDTYCAVDDNVWFISAKPAGNKWSLRCYRSVDRGQNWTVSPTFATLGGVTVEFSSALKGVVVDSYYATSSQYFYITSDGGDTWSKVSIPGNELPVVGASHIEGFDGGFVMGLVNNANFTSTLVFTPDFFTTTVTIDSNLMASPLSVNFKGATTGWIGARAENSNAVLKFTGILTDIIDLAKPSVKLAIVPNPTSTEALVKLPVLNEKGDLSLAIFDDSGKLCENKPFESTTGWTKLNASGYKTGVYVLQVLSGNRVIASTKWVVQH